MGAVDCDELGTAETCSVGGAFGEAVARLFEAVGRVGVCETG